MQPRVEDEEEEGQPPPPPVHRLGLGQMSLQVGPNPAPLCQPYFPEHGSPQGSGDVNLLASLKSPSSQASHLPTEKAQFPDLPPHTTGPEMPPSLIAGYDPLTADAESERAVQESRAIRRRSGMNDDIAAVSQPPEPRPYEPPAYPLRTSPRPGSSGGSTSPDSRVVARKSVSPQPSSPAQRGIPDTPYSPDSYNSLNPNASRPVVTRDTTYETPPQSKDAAIRKDSGAGRDSEPIIGDDGREIDPSDHLPTDTWAPEPERKTRKPEVIIRFRHSPRTQTSPSKTSTSPRAPFKSQPIETGSYSAEHAGSGHPQSSPMNSAPDPFDRASPRGREVYNGHGHNRNYSTPTATGSPRSSHRGSVSPSPGSHSPSTLYEINPGPPIPAKMPVARPMSRNYPVETGPQGMDALSRELNSIDIGSVGCSPGRNTRKYTSKSPATTGYAM